MTLTLGIDLGTSGVRCMAIDEAGEKHGQAAARIAPDQRRNPAALWYAVEATLSALETDLGTGMADIAAIAVDGTSGTIIVTDNQGKPLAPASLYNDQAQPDHLTAVTQVAPTGSAALGATSPLARMIGLAATPNAAHLLHEADWVAYRLGAPLGMSDANNALKSGYDIIARDWPAWIDALSLDRTMLPDVVEPGTPTGIIAGDIAAVFAIPRTTRIAAGTTDGCASFLATGADTQGDGVTALGSTLTLKILSETAISAPKYGIYSHRLLGNFLPGGAANAGAAVLARFFTPDQIAELSRHIDPARDSGLDYYPLPSPGERFPINDPALPPRLAPRPTDDSHFLHGMFEGLARIEALGYTRLAELGAPAVTRVLSVGGGAINPVWTALRQRIIGVPVTAAPETEAAYGAALLARHCLE